MSRVVARIPLPNDLVEWLSSEPGRLAMATAVKKSQSEVDELNMARRVQRDQLHIPITL